VSIERQVCAVTVPTIDRSNNQQTLSMDGNQIATVQQLFDNLLMLSCTADHLLKQTGGDGDVEELRFR
jgi:hypothetical protein